MYLNAFGQSKAKDQDQPIGPMQDEDEELEPAESDNGERTALHSVKRRSYWLSPVLLHRYESVLGDA